MTTTLHFLAYGAAGRDCDREAFYLIESSVDNTKTVISIDPHCHKGGKPFTRVEICDDDGTGQFNLPRQAFFKLHRLGINHLHLYDDRALASAPDGEIAKFIAKKSAELNKVPA